MGGEELKRHQLISSQGPHFSPHSTAKINDESTNLRKNGSMKKLMMMMMKMIISIISIIIIMNKSQESTVFGGRQKLTSAMKLRPEKLW